MSLRRAVALFAAAICTACGGTETCALESGEAAQLTLKLGSSDFNGRSVRITGVRVDAADLTTPLPARSVYRCDSTLIDNNCFNLDATATVTVSGLCPSEDLPTAVWNFSYQLYAAPNCTGGVLNPAIGVPLKCYDSHDLFSRLYPNATYGEALHPGAANHNAIVCAVGRLAFVQQPTTSTAGLPINPPVTVQLRDAFGADAPQAGVSVTVAVASGPGSFTPTSTTTATTDANGLATFSNLVLTTTGTYTLIASTSGLLSTTSNSFVIVSATPSYLVYTATGPVATRTSNGNLTVLYPAGTSTNDLLLLVVVNAANQNSTAPATWTLVSNRGTNSPQRFRFQVWWRLAGAETSVTLSARTDANGISAWVVRYRRPTGYPPNPALATAAISDGLAGPSATLTPTPDITTNQPNATVISIVAIRAANALSLSTPRGFLLENTTTSMPKQGVAFGIADLLVMVSGTTPPSPTWSQSGTPAQWAWLTVAFY